MRHSSLNFVCLVFVVLILSACTAPDSELVVNLDVSSISLLDPFQKIKKVRVRIDGPERFDDAIVYLEDGQQTAVFKNFPLDSDVSITAQGFDDNGLVYAFGQSEEFKVGSENEAVTIAFRRLFAYVIHDSICDGGCKSGQACVDTGEGYSCSAVDDLCDVNCSDSQACVSLTTGSRCLETFQGKDSGPEKIYVLDPQTRSVVQSLKLPVPNATASSIRADRGERILVTFETDETAYLGLLSQKDHTWKTFTLPRPGAIALAGRNNLGVIAGQGRVYFINLESGEIDTQGEQATAGRILDGSVGDGGRKAVIVMSGQPGVLLVDFDRKEIYPPGQIEGAAGVGVSDDGRLAYINSSTTRQVRVLDLRTVGLSLLQGEFFGSPGISTFSSVVSGLLGVYVNEDENINRVIGYSVSGKRAFEMGSEVNVLPSPRGIASLPGSNRVLIVSAGTSTLSAGITMIDPNLETGLEASTTVYPLDVEDSYVNRAREVSFQRYRPGDVAVTYGR